MNYTSIKLGFIIAVTVIGIVIANNCFKAMTNIMEKQAEKLEFVYTLGE